MPFDYSPFKDVSGFLGKGESAKDQRKARRNAVEMSIEDAYAVVDARDGLVSVVTGVNLYKASRNWAVLLEHHHLRKRSLDKARQGDPDNIISVSHREAFYLDTHALVPVDDQGEETFHYSEIVEFRWDPERMKPGAKPFTVIPFVRKVV
jgi:hypothetical protein